MRTVGDFGILTSTFPTTPPAPPPANEEDYEIPCGLDDYGDPTTAWRPYSVCQRFIISGGTTTREERIFMNYFCCGGDCAEPLVWCWDGNQYTLTSYDSCVQFQCSNSIPPSPWFGGETVIRYCDGVISCDAPGMGCAAGYYCCAGIGCIPNGVGC